MTQEEKSLLLKDLCTRLPYKDYLIPNPNSIDWLNSHHFDYRGLIGKGLKIKVTEENNPYALILKILWKKLPSLPR